MQRTGTLLHVDYTVEDNSAVLRLLCKDEDGIFVALERDFSPYLYVIPEDAPEELRDDIRNADLTHEEKTVNVASARVEERVVDGAEQSVVVVEAQIPADVPKLRAAIEERFGVKAHEYDIPFARRYLIDKGLKPLDTYTVEGEETTYRNCDAIALDNVEESDAENAALDLLAFDIELADSDEIIMASFQGSDFKKVLVSHDFPAQQEWVESVKDEENLLQRIQEIFSERDPDILLTYNGDEFDLPRLRDRAKTHDVELIIGKAESRIRFQGRGRRSVAKIFGTVHLDLYRYVERMLGQHLKSETLTLDNVAHELLGKEKIDLHWEDIISTWREKEDAALKKLSAYSLRDAEITHELGETVLPQIQSFCRLIGITPFEVCRTSYGNLVERFLLRNAYTQGRVAPNRPHDEEFQKRRRQTPFAGGFVLEPEEGLYENIAVFDFRSLYPSIIVAHNIDPATLDCDCCEGPDIEDIKHHFCEQEDGFVPSLLRDVVEQRYALKEKMATLEGGTQAYRDVDNRQFALKILANSFYGYYGFAGARWYCRDCAATTAALGRHYIKQAIKTAEEMGLNPIYGDTDSAMLSHPNIQEKGPAFQETVNAELPQFMELEREGFFPRGLFTYTKSGKGAKKRYALIDEEGDIKITGFEQVRRDWSNVAKNVQEQVIQKVLEGDAEAAVASVRDTIEKVQNQDIPKENFIIYTTLTKKPENYKSKAPHVEAAKHAIEAGYDISPGDTIRYIVTPENGSISDRARIAEEAGTYDPDYYIENQILPAAMRILKVLGYTEDDVRKGTQTGLETFTD